VQAGQDHGVEFEALGLVDGHELDRLAGLGIGRGVEIGHLAFEFREAEAAAGIEAR
jgi:hypothetical protein